MFNANVVQRRKAERQRAKEKPALLSPTEARRTRQAAGWRGLSVDLITGGGSVSGSAGAAEGDDDYDDGIVGREERLEGCIVKSIWRRSRLDKARLAEIWCVAVHPQYCDSRILTFHKITGLNATQIIQGYWTATDSSRACGGSMRNFDGRRRKP